MRPVFLIVMGVSLFLIALRLRGSTHGWSARLTMTGATLLALGYSVLLPLYEAKLIVPLSHIGAVDGSVDLAIAGHLLKMLLMNVGWVLLGTGVALHANVFEKAPAPVKIPATPPLHETPA